MNPEVFQREAMRTECDQIKSLSRMNDEGELDQRTALRPIRLTHAVLGLSAEVGELASAVEDWIFYGRGELNAAGIAEEVGDCLWRLAQICDATGIDLGACMAANNNKLRVRYPDKFTEERAARENRNLKAEQEAMIQNGHGWAEPPYNHDKDVPTLRVTNNPASLPVCETSGAGHDWYLCMNEVGTWRVCGRCGKRESHS